MTLSVKHCLHTFLFCVLITPLIALSAERNAEGHWEGAIELPTMRLQVSMDLAKQGDQWTGTISIPQQNAKNLALKSITGDPSAVAFTIPNIPGDPTFKGAVSDDNAKLSGNFTQGLVNRPFALERKAAPDVVAADALKGFDTFVDGTLKPWDVPGAAVVIVRNGKVIFVKGFGQRDVKNNLPVTPDTLFPIGSSTKAFTTFTLGTLVDEGKLDWDKPVRHYLADFQMYDPTATLALTPRDLVTHRSGLPRHDLVWYNNQDLTRGDIVARLRYLKPNAELREKWQYNNLMFLTAGYLIEQLTGDTWEHAVRKRVLDPLGMKRTTFSDADSQKDSDFSKPYRKEKDKVIEIPFREVGNMGPAGSINSSVNELSHWLMVQLAKGKYDNQQLIQASTLQQTHMPQMAMPGLPQQAELGITSYAMGWMVGSHRGHLEIQHGGNIDGFSALVALFPSDDTGIVVLTNANGTPLTNIVVAHAADRLFGLPAKDWNGEALGRKTQAEAIAKLAEQKKSVYRVANTKPSHALDDFVGEYQHPGYGTIAVTMKGSALQARYNRIDTPMEHWHYDVFNALRGDDPVFADAKFQFHTNIDGAVASLSATMEPSVDPIIFAKRADAKQFDTAYLQTLIGDYQLGAQTVGVTLQGAKLFAAQQGQATELIPAVGGWFALKSINAIQLRFETDAKTGKMTCIFKQPNGVFTAIRR